MTDSQERELITKLMADAHQAIALLLNFYNNIETSLIVLFEQLAGITPRVAHAILGEPRLNDLQRVIKDLAELDGPMKPETKRVWDSINSDIHIVNTYRSVVAHQQIGYQTPDKVTFTHTARALAEKPYRTVYSVQELTDVGFFASRIASRINLELEAHLLGRPLPDEAVLKPLRERPELPTYQGRQSRGSPKSQRPQRQ